MGDVEIERLNLLLRETAATPGAVERGAGLTREALKSLLRPLVIEILEEVLRSERRVRGRQ